MRSSTPAYLTARTHASRYSFQIQSPATKLGGADSEEVRRRNQAQSPVCGGHKSGRVRKIRAWRPGFAILRFATVKTRILTLFISTVALTVSAADPKFEAETIDPAIEVGYGLAIADVDGDGKDDILLADKREFVWYQNPSWKKHVMIRNLTLRDNVCLAARDLDGDGKCEVAVGANWNPGETTSEKDSGSVHYLIAPEDRTQMWTAVKLPHEPTVHRMHWVRTTPSKWELVMLPLHGRGNKGGEGDPVKVIGYTFPKDPTKAENWKTRVVAEQLHKSHNFDVDWQDAGAETMILAGAEGLLKVQRDVELAIDSSNYEGSDGAGEVRFGPDYIHRGSVLTHYTAIEPLHGNAVVIYSVEKETSPEHKPVWSRRVIDDSLAQGHALACADLLGLGRQQIVVGWRNPDANKKVGIKLYTWNQADDSWATHLIDDNEMAAEDLKVSDLDGDGRLDIIAAGRKTQNVKIYWNKSSQGSKPELSGGWKKHEIWKGAHCPTAVAADFNGDGKQDVAISAGGKDWMLVAPNWEPVQIHSGEGRSRGCIHSEVMDVDGDGDMDFIGGARMVFWLENPGGEAALKGDWKFRYADNQISGVHCVLRADVNQDGKPDLIANEFNPKGDFADSITWQEPPAEKDGQWTRHIFAAGDAGGGNHYMGMGDIDGDGDNDIACGAKGKPFVDGNWFAWWENTGQEKWTKHVLAKDQIGATCILPADLDGDGDTDMMASRGHGTGVLWFENQDDKKFQLHEIDPLLSGPHCLTISDLDGDGDIDAATTAKDDARTVWYENNGKGQFTIHDIDDNQAAYDIRSVDMDGDGDLDLLVAGQRSQNVVWYENQM